MRTAPRPADLFDEPVYAPRKVTKWDAANECIYIQIRKCFCGVSSWLDRSRIPATGVNSEMMARLDNFCDLLLLLDSYPEAWSIHWNNLIEQHLIGESIYRENARIQQQELPI